jgi:hypothetical protein
MFVDFAVNNSGDLIFAKKDDKYKSLCLKFNLTKTKTQKISFLTSDSTDVEHSSDNYLKLSFTIQNNDFKTTDVVFKDKEALIQLISLQLKTTEGELPYRTTDGSKLTTFRHQNINTRTLRNLESYLKTFLADYIYNPSVTATPVIDYNNGYKQAVELYIYSNNNLLLQYNVES